jgi:hypothetical protein
MEETFGTWADINWIAHDHPRVLMTTDPYDDWYDLRCHECGLFLQSDFEARNHVCA